MEDITIKLRITEDLYNQIESFRETELFEQTLERIIEHGLDVMVSKRVDQQIENEQMDYVI
jgi:hypothetical protein